MKAFRNHLACLISPALLVKSLRHRFVSDWVIANINPGLPTSFLCLLLSQTGYQQAWRSYSFLRTFRFSLTMGPKTQTDTMPDLTGRSLDGGRYRLLESLGSGAYGKVYRAIDISRQLSSPKFYAIKCMNKPASGTHPELLQKREFSHHKRVSSHPNVVTFHRTWADRHQVYVVLDLCTGGDLFSAITERGVFYKNSKLIKNTFIQLISAVRYCHAMGVYHRDIKPENVLCSDDGSEIWLADFGLSTTKKISRDFGCGSSYYMSPGMS